MKSKRSSRILALLVLASAAIFGANAANYTSGAAQLTTRGTYAVTFHVNTPTTVPDGATIACNASIQPPSTFLERMFYRSAPAIHSTTGIARVVNSSATCTVDAPVAFRAHALNAALSYRINAFTAAGPVFSRTQQNIAVAYPQAGSRVSLPLDVNF